MNVTNNYKKTISDSFKKTNDNANIYEHNIRFEFF